MRGSTSSTSVLFPALRAMKDGLLRRHIHALSDETLRCALAYLRPRDLRGASYVCTRWRRVAAALILERGDPSRVGLLPWNVLHRVFAQLDSFSLSAAACVCAQWRRVAFCFFSTQIRRRHVHDLPAEVVKRAFALLDFEALRYAAQVCVRWRDLGIEHPGFWKYIEVRSAKPGSLELLAARLGQSWGRPCSLTVDIEGLHNLIETKLMDLLTAIMPSVQHLTIRLDALYLISLWRVLNHAAPQLATFHLKLYSPGRLMARVPISPWIFDEKPGLLRLAHIEDVTLAMVQLGPPAFANLRELRMIHPSGSFCDFPGVFLEWCPNLRDLVIYCGTITFNQPLSEAALQGLARLESLDVYLDPEARTAFVQSLPMRDIPIVIVAAPPDFDAFYDFLLPLRSPFNLAVIRGQCNMFFVIVEDDRCAHHRAFTELVKHYEAPTGSNEHVNLIFENDLFPPQVISLQVSVSLWRIVSPHLALYAVVGKLILDLDQRDACDRWFLPAEPLPFPNLTTLVLQSRAEFIFLPAEDIVRLVDVVLCAPLCRALELHCVLLSGERQPVLRRFDHILYTPNAMSARTILPRPKY